MEFPPESEVSSTRVALLPQSDALLEFGTEDCTPVGPARTDRRRPTSWVSGAWRAFRNGVVRDGRQCLTWLSTCQADLRVGLSGMADSFAGAVRAAGESTSRHLRLALCSARPTLNAIAMRGSLFTSRRTFHGPRPLIHFGCGVAVGGVVMLFLPLQSTPGATIPAPGPALSQHASRTANVTLLASVRPPEIARSVGVRVEQMVTATGKREPDKASPVIRSRPQPSSRRNAPSLQRTPTPKLARYRGSLAVNSAPTGATVVVNGVPVGTTPLLLKDLPVGSRVVRLELDGYQRWSSAVSVVANQRVRTAVDLRPFPSNK